MGILDIYYEPNIGDAFRDGNCDQKVTEIIGELCLGDVLVWTSTENIIAAIRVAIMQGRINYANVRMWYYVNEAAINATQLPIDRDGNLQNWPNGFCDYIEKQLTILIGWDRYEEDATSQGRQEAMANVATSLLNDVASDTAAKMAVRGSDATAGVGD